ncbi:MAG: hypothetical protein JWN88_1626 [Frankiales bacterium]|jgi:hypothetical protein|nr:hypothetical protein [Frankiales bacterium]
MTTAARGGRHAAPRRPGPLQGRGRHGRPGRSRPVRILLLPLVGAPVLLALGTTAHAYWSTPGSGEGQAGAGTSATLPVTASSPATASLYPGATSDLSFSVANPNPYAVSLTKLTAATVSSSYEAGCPGATSLLLAEPVRTAIASGGYQLPNPVLVPAGHPGTVGSIPALVTLSAQAPDACQGVSFTVTLDFSGSQA